MNTVTADKLTVILDLKEPYDMAQYVVTLSAQQNVAHCSVFKVSTSLKTTVPRLCHSSIDIANTIQRKKRQLRVTSSGYHTEITTAKGPVAPTLTFC